MFFIANTLKGQVCVFTGQVKIVSNLSCRTSAISKYFCPLLFYHKIVLESHMRYIGVVGHIWDISGVVATSKKDKQRVVSFLFLFYFTMTNE